MSLIPPSHRKTSSKLNYPSEVVLAAGAIMLTPAEWAQAGTGGLVREIRLCGEPSNGLQLLQLSLYPLPCSHLGGANQCTSLCAPCQPGHTIISQTVLI